MGLPELRCSQARPSAGYGIYCSPVRRTHKPGSKSGPPRWYFAAGHTPGVGHSMESPIRDQFTLPPSRESQLNQMKKASPIIFSSGTKPQYRLSLL